MGYRRFMVRGLESVSKEWDLVCLTYNLRRMFSLKQKNDQKDTQIGESTQARQTAGREEHRSLSGQDLCSDCLTTFQSFCFALGAFDEFPKGFVGSTSLGKSGRV